MAAKSVLSRMSQQYGPCEDNTRANSEHISYTRAHAKSSDIFFVPPSCRLPARPIGRSSPHPGDRIQNSTGQNNAAPSPWVRLCDLSAALVARGRENSVFKKILTTRHSGELCLRQSIVRNFKHTVQSGGSWDTFIVRCGIFVWCVRLCVFAVPENPENPVRCWRFTKSRGVGEGGAVLGAHERPVQVYTPEYDVLTKYCCLRWTFRTGLIKWTTEKK